MATGPHTRLAPTAGSSESTAITTPHSTAPCTPSAQKASPPSMPCTTATTTLPLTVARPTVANLRMR